MHTDKDNTTLFFEIYTKGNDDQSEIYSSDYLRSLIWNQERNNCRFNFNIQAPKEKPVKTRTDRTEEHVNRTKSTCVWSYYEWKKKYPNTVIIIKDDWDIMTFEKGAIVVEALLKNNRFCSYYEDYRIKPPDVRVPCYTPFITPHYIAKLAIEGISLHGSRIVLDDVLKKLEEYRISYIVVERNNIIKQNQFVGHHRRMALSFVSGYCFSNIDFHNAYSLGNGKRERYFDGCNWKRVNRVKKKRSSEWINEYPETVILENPINDIGAYLNVIGEGSKKVIKALTLRNNEECLNMSPFMIADYLETAQIDYIIIHSGKIEIKNSFKNGKDNYQKYVNAGHEDDKTLSVKYMTEEKDYQQKVSYINDMVQNELTYSKDGIVAHEIANYRRNLNRPDLAIRLFKDFEYCAGNHMFVAVAAAYNATGDYTSALHYVEKASDSEYKEKTKEKILRNMELS